MKAIDKNLLRQMSKSAFKNETFKDTHKFTRKLFRAVSKIIECGYAHRLRQSEPEMI